MFRIWWCNSTSPYTRSQSGGDLWLKFCTIVKEDKLWLEKPFERMRFVMP